MTLEEFKSFKRGIALNAVKFKQGKLNGDELYEALVVTLGKDTFDETVKTMQDIANESK